MATAKEPKAPIQKVKISKEQILAMLAEGKDRNQIGKELGLNKTQVKLIFSRPGLKGMKVKRKPEEMFEFTDEDNLEDVNTNTTVVNETANVATGEAVAEEPNEADKGW